MESQFLRKAVWFAGLLIIGLVTANVLLIRQNVEMRSQLSKYQPQKLEKGAAFQNFTAKDLGGNQIDVNFSENSPKRIFLYFTPTCPYCKQQFPEWKELIREAKERNIEVLGVVSENEKQEEIKKYLNSYDCGMNSQNPLNTIFVSDEILQKYKLNLTPITVSTTEAGKVENIWIGKWKADEKGSILASLK